MLTVHRKPKWQGLIDYRKCIGIAEGKFRNQMVCESRTWKRSTDWFLSARREKQHENLETVETPSTRGTGRNCSQLLPGWPWPQFLYKPEGILGFSSLGKLKDLSRFPVITFRCLNAFFLCQSSPCMWILSRDKQCNNSGYSDLFFSLLLMGESIIWHFGNTEKR